MLAEDVLPAGWTPMTSLIIKVLHIDDKPEFLDDDTVVFSEAPDGIDTYRLKNKIWRRPSKLCKSFTCIFSFFIGA